MATQQIQSGRWNEVMGRIRSKWGQINDDELRTVEGNTQQLIGLIQKKTGEAREKVEKQLNDWLSQGENSAEGISAAAQEMAGRASEQLQEGYERVSDSVRAGYHDAEKMVQQRPVESVAVAFGSGLIAGVLVSLMLRSR